MADKLSDRLLDKVSKAIYTDTNTDWKIYIHDHKAKLIASASLVSIDPDSMAQYLYRPDLYLKEIHDIEYKHTWIFMFINNLNSYMDFNVLISEVYVPDTKQISSLLSTFRSVIAAGAKR